MGFFDSFRDNGWNTYYGDVRSSALVNIKHVIVIFFAVILAAGLMMVVIGTRGKERWTTLFRLVFSLHTGVIVLVCLTGNYWQVSYLRSHCEYASVTPNGVVASIGVRIGLKTVNITLQGTMNTTHGVGQIDYNERFSYDGVHDIEEDYLEAKLRGLPQAILYVLEYFGVDDGGLRWCRAIRAAGYFAYIFLWCSFVSWFVANVLLCFVVFRGAALMTLTGGLMLLACILYSSLQPTIALSIPFEDGHLVLHFGWCFWLCVVSGAITLLTGGAIMVLYWMYPAQTSMVFLIDKSHLSDDEEPVDVVGPLEIETPYMRRRKMSHAFFNEGFMGDEDVTTPDSEKPPPYWHQFGTVPSPDVDTVGRKTCPSDGASACRTGKVAQPRVKEPYIVPNGRGLKDVKHGTGNGHYESKSEDVVDRSSNTSSPQMTVIDVDKEEISYLEGRESPFAMSSL